MIVEFSGDIRGLVQPDTSNYAYATAIPLCEAVAIHVPDQKAKRELLARSYKNIHVYDDLIQITPQLFAGDTETGAPAPPGPASSVDWQLIDRVRGAVSAAISAAESGEQLALVARCLGAAVSDGVADDTVPWLNLSVLNDFDRAAANTANRDFATSDSLLFKVVYGVLARMDASTAWSPRAFLDAVAQAVKSGSAAPSSGEIAQNLNRVRQIIDVEAEFKPFPARGGLVSAKAMLLFSLRLDLAQLLSWPTAETGADDGTRVVAAIFAGRLRGLSREDTKLRSRDFDDITARWAVGVAARDDPPLGDVAFIAQNDRTELLVGGVVVRRAEALLPDPAKIYRSVERAEQKAVRVKVAKIMNWPVTTVIRIGGDYETREFESGAEIETSGTFEWAQDVDESDFMQWLSESRRDRKFLLRAIASARKNSRGEPSE
ncbi:hypothetical protein A6B34_20650 [Mycolicibacterium monacense]|nr:hypothetical protein A6B34_20650 [Mycolicibacterium monacense]